MSEDVFDRGAAAEAYTEALTAFFKVMGDQSRVRIIYALSDQGEMCVGDLSKTVRMTQSAVSHQLRLLKLNGLVKSRKEGKNVYYALEDDHVIDILKLALTHIRHRENEKSQKAEV